MISNKYLSYCMAFNKNHHTVGHSTRTYYTVGHSTRTCHTDIQQEPTIPIGYPTSTCHTDIQQEPTIPIGHSTSTCHTVGHSTRTYYTNRTFNKNLSYCRTFNKYLSSCRTSNTNLLPIGYPSSTCPTDIQQEPTIPIGYPTSTCHTVGHSTSTYHTVGHSTSTCHTVGHSTSTCHTDIKYEPTIPIGYPTSTCHTVGHSTSTCHTVGHSTSAYHTVGHSTSTFHTDIQQEPTIPIGHSTSTCHTVGHPTSTYHTDIQQEPTIPIGHSTRTCHTVGHSTSTYRTSIQQEPAIPTGYSTNTCYAVGHSTRTYYTNRIFNKYLSYCRTSTSTYYTDIQQVPIILKDIQQEPSIPIGYPTSTCHTNVTKSPITSPRKSETNEDEMSNLEPEENVSPPKRKRSPFMQKCAFATESPATRNEYFASPVTSNVTKSTFTSARNTETKKDVMSNLVPETNVSPSNRKCSPPKQKWDFAKEYLATRKECFRSPVKSQTNTGDVYNFIISPWNPSASTSTRTNRINESPKTPTRTYFSMDEDCITGFNLNAMPKKKRRIRQSAVEASKRERTSSTDQMFNKALFTNEELLNFSFGGKKGTLLCPEKTALIKGTRNNSNKSDIQSKCELNHYITLRSSHKNVILDHIRPVTFDPKQGCKGNRCKLNIRLPVNKN
ncbi:unnamed protein product [Mytilus edulis]|uniref:Uncharacterized protein n=1 Tax=Mytilus edulis TaxID=6550 RepID=A0A8S3V5N7_MYTED|nr:unnamed protein product [Mytilus edulis]